MADRPAARARPVAAVPERDDGLAALNDHLGRFLRQADDLLDEWTRFSADVRTRVDGEVARLGDTVADAIDASVDHAAARVEGEVGARLVARLGAVTDDLDRVTAAARRAAAATAALQVDRRRSAHLAAAALVAALVSNVLLAIVLAVLLSRSNPPAAAAPAAVREPDAAVAPADAAPPPPDAAVPLPDAAPVHPTEVKPPPVEPAAGKRGATRAPPRRRGH